MVFPINLLYHTFTLCAILFLFILTNYLKGLLLLNVPISVLSSIAIYIYYILVIYLSLSNN
ncbi:hypothetical protein [Brochothrix phage ADU4]|nr:hypothetical protein [Brochothrix phage ADU4]